MESFECPASEIEGDFPELDLLQVPVLDSQNEHDQSAGFEVGQAVQARWKVRPLYYLARACT